MMSRIIKIILVIIGTFLGIIILDTVQALVFNNEIIIGRGTNCMRKEGIFVDTYYCPNGKKITRLKKSNVCYSTEDVCRDKQEKKEEKLQTIENGDISMYVIDDSITSKGATFVIKNNTDIECIYGVDYLLEKKIGDEWKEVDTLTVSPLVWNLIGYTLNSNEQSEINIDWSIGYGELESGNYRLVKTFSMENDPKVLNSYAEFTIR